MKAMKWGIWLLLGLLLTACSSQPRVVTDHDTAYNFSALRSFHVLPSGQGDGDTVLISPFTFSHLHSLISRELGARYLALDEAEGADFLVRYHIVLEERLDLRAYDHRYGFGYYGYGPRYRPYPYLYAPGPTPRVVRQGTLIVDMVDGKTNEPIWRGVSAHRLRDGLSPQEQREILSAATTEILNNFPPVR